MAPFKFDFLSFLAGFAAASVLWLVVWRFRANWAQIRDSLGKQTASLRKKNLQDVETYLKQGTYRRAQRLHLAASLFPLEEILIPPMVIAPPPSPDSSGNLPEVGVLDQVIPYTPDWPEIAANYGYFATSLSEIASQRADIALIGRPGVGKTTALAHLATEIFEKRVDDPRLVESVPIFLHVLDLQPVLLNNPDAADALVDAFTAKTSINLQKQARTVVRASLQESRAILLLDGLDELSPGEVNLYSNYVASLKKQYSGLQIIAACSDVYMDGLVSHGFTPIAVAPWNQLQVRQFIFKFGQTWKELVLPQITKAINVPQPDPLAMESWINSNGVFFTPFEWTELVWGAYAGDLAGSQPSRAIGAHLKRIFQGDQPISLFGALAAGMLSTGRSSLSFEQAEDLLTKYSGNFAREVKAENQPELPAEDSAKTSKSTTSLSDQIRKGTKVVVQTAGERAIVKAIELGLLVEYGANQVTFSHLPVAAFLAAMHNQGEVAPINLQWSFSLLAAEYGSSDGKNKPAVLDLLKPDGDPLRSKLALAGRLMAPMPPNSELRIQIMRRLVGEIQQENLPVGTRTRLLSACTVSNDPSVAILFRQWLTSPSSTLRRLAALGCGVLKDVKGISEISDLMADPDFRTHATAAIALTSIPGDPAQNAISIAFAEGTETLRRAVAEALAVNPDPACQDLLKDAVTSEDLLVRRAAVFGLSMRRQPWTHELLTKIAVEDGQWVVRNAAAQTIEIHQQPDPRIPMPMPPYWESPWLITFAGKHGDGISPDEIPYKILYQALESGTEEDQAMACKYLDLSGGDESLKMIRQLLQLKDEAVSERALQSLWRLSLS